MPLKVYRARSMTEALTEVKKDLGQDAVILHTRTFKTPGVLGFGARNMVEITATDDEPTVTKRRARLPRKAPEQTTMPTPSVRAHAATKAYAGAGAAGPFDPTSLVGAGPAVALMAPPGARPASPTVTATPKPQLLRVATSRQDKPPSGGPALEDELHSIKRMLGRGKSRPQSCAGYSSAPPAPVAPAPSSTSKSSSASIKSAAATGAGAGAAAVSPSPLPSPSSLSSSSSLSWSFLATLIAFLMVLRC